MGTLWGHCGALGVHANFIREPANSGRSPASLVRISCTAHLPAWFVEDIQALSICVQKSNCELCAVEYYLADMSAGAEPP